MDTTRTTPTQLHRSLTLLASCAVIAYGVLTSTGHAGTRTLEVEGSSSVALPVITDTIGGTLALTHGGGGAGVFTIASGTSNASSAAKISVGPNVSLEINNGNNLPGGTSLGYVTVTTGSLVYYIPSNNYTSSDFTGIVTIPADFAALHAYSGSAPTDLAYKTAAVTGLANTSAGTGASALTLSGGTLKSAAAVTVTTPITVGSASSIDTTTGSLTINGEVTFSAPLTVKSTNANPLTFNGANTGTNAITVGTDNTGNDAALSLTSVTALGGDGTNPTVSGITLKNGSKLKVGVNMTLPPITLS